LQTSQMESAVGVIIPGLAPIMKWSVVQNDSRKYWVQTTITEHSSSVTSFIQQSTILMDSSVLLYLGCRHCDTWQYIGHLGSEKRSDLFILPVWNKCEHIKHDMKLWFGLYFCSNEDALMYQSLQSEKISKNDSVSADDLKSMVTFLNNTFMDRIPTSESNKLEHMPQIRTKVAAQTLIFCLARLKSEKTILDEAAKLIEPLQDKPVCKYGASCYQKNPLHRSTFSHPEASPLKKVKNDLNLPNVFGKSVKQGKNINVDEWTEAEWKVEEASYSPKWSGQPGSEWW